MGNHRCCKGYVYERDRIMLMDIIWHRISVKITAFKTWWFWYSPFWKRTERCHECSGLGGKSKRDDWFQCGMCRGTGETLKRKGC